MASRAENAQPRTFRVHRYRAAEDRLQDEDGTGPPGRPGRTADEAGFDGLLGPDDDGNWDMWERTATGAVLQANSGPRRPPQPPGDGQRTVRCRLCRENNFAHCDALHDPDDALRDLGCTRCARWGLECVDPAGWAELPTDQHAAGTGPVEALLFPPCAQCKASGRGCDRYVGTALRRDPG